MKIALYSPGWPLEKMQNGIVTYVDVMRDALRAAGHEVVIITGKNLAEESAEIFASRPGGGVSNWIARAARKRFGGEAGSIKQFGYNIAAALDRASKGGEVDVFEIEETYGHALTVQDATGAPTIMRLHGPHFLGKFGAMDDRDQLRIDMEGEALRRVGAITSPSPGVLRDTLAHYANITAHTEVIANPVRLPADKDCWRRKDADSKLIAWVGRFDLRKGADTMLEAFSRLAGADKSIRLAMAGKDAGIESDNGEVLKFQDYASRYLSDDIRQRIDFLGPIPTSEVTALRKRAGFCVSSSRFECCAYAVMETLAMGCPALATATYGAAEFLEDGKEIMISPVENAEALAEKMSELISNPTLTEEIGAAGREAAARCFSPETIAEQSVNHYRRLASSAAG